jgi:hypothetical protein
MTKKIDWWMLVYCFNVFNGVLYGMILPSTSMSPACIWIIILVFSFTCAFNTIIEKLRQGYHFKDLVFKIHF